MRMAPNWVPPPQEKPGPKSCHPLTNPSWSGEPPPQVEPHRNAEDPSQILVENSQALWLDDNVLLHPSWEPQWIWSPLPGLLASTSILATSGLTWNSRMVGPATHNLRLCIKNYMPSPASSSFQIMRKRKTLALARVLQTHAKESGCPTRVLCEVAWQLQWCMVSLLVFNGNEIVEVSLLKSIEGKCRTSPMPEEEAALLGHIKPDIEAPQVPEHLEIHEQIQPAEWTVAPTDSLPSPPHEVPFLPQSQRSLRTGQLEWMPSVPPNGFGPT